MIHWEEGMVTRRQSRRQPGCRGMAGRTRGRPTRRHMIRICGPGEICLVAGVTIRRGSCEDVVDVA